MGWSDQSCDGILTMPMSLASHPVVPSVPFRKATDFGLACQTLLSATEFTKGTYRTGYPLPGAVVPVVVQPPWPQLQAISGLSEAPSQNALQNLLSLAAIQTHEG
jgi:hypothetical protein